MDGNETNKLVKGALLLTLAGVISKLLSAGYRIPLQNLTGDVGFYAYQQVYPILGIASVLALYGFPTAISKLAAERRQEGIGLSGRNFHIPILFLMFGIAGCFFIFLLLNAHSLALLVGDVKLVSGYRVAAFVFLFIPLVALWRGSFQGSQEMKPTAVSQVGEQLVRVGIIIAAAVYVYRTGVNIHRIGQAAGLASMAGLLMATLLLGWYMLRAKNNQTSRSDAEVPWQYYLRTIIIFGMVASLNHMVLLIIQFADTFTFVPSLIKHGMTPLDAMRTKGIFDRGQPLIQMGTVLGSAFALALVPSISAKRPDGGKKTVDDSIARALSFSFYLSLGAGLGLILIFPETNLLLFQDTHGTQALRVLVLSMILSPLAITAASILQGLGFVKRTAGFILGAFFVKWIANQLFIPIWGMMGGAFATILSLMLLALVVLYELKRKLPGLRFLRSIHWRASLLASAGMTVYIFVIKKLLPEITSLSRPLLLGEVLFLAGTGALIYLVILIRCHAFTEKELGMVPFASKFIGLIRKDDRK